MTKHKEWIRDVFDRVSTDYSEEGSECFNTFGEALVYYGLLSEGESVLDVATGKGAIAFPAAEAVGPTGKVIGIDLSAEMIKEAKKRGAFDWLEFHQMDAESLSFEDESFDVVFCGFALSFFSDIPRVLSECKRVLKPGGCLIVSVWGKRPALDLWVIERAKALGASKKLQTVSINRPEEVISLFEKAGFVEVETTEDSHVFEQKSPETWWKGQVSYALQPFLDQLTEENRKLLQIESIEKVRGMGKINEERQAFYVFGEKPE